MDLNSIMNEGDGADAKPKRQSPEAQRNVQPPAMGLGLPPQQPPVQPQYGRPDGGYPAPPRLQMPSTVAQHPYPPHAQSSAPSGSRGASFGPPQYPQHSPSQHHPGLPQQGSTYSISPTPSSHHTHTPQSMRQSPHAPQPQPHPQYSYPNPPHLNSQPSTPLGPPPPQFSRAQSNFESPIHHRTFSGASNGPHSGSPGFYPPGHQIPSPQVRRTSSHIERERSVSVSPKTIPRPTSMGSSRQSSQQEVYGSSRSSIQTLQGPIAGSPGHVPQPYPPQFAPPPQVTQGAPAIHPFAQPGVADESLSRQATHQPPPSRPPLLHQTSSKMGMNNLLTPSSEIAPIANGASLSAGAMVAENVSVHGGPNGVQPGAQSMRPGKSSTPPPPPPSHQPQIKQEIDSAQDTSSESKPSLKRSATEANDQPPSKQRKTTVRKYSQRPPWAQLSRHNPRFQQQRQPNMPQINGQSMANGSAPDGRPPWLHNPPLDMDLIGARDALGPWEKSMRWNTPYPDMLRVVQDWLFSNLEQLGDIGTNPQEGSVEIEAKIGYLIDNDTDRRLQLPVMTMCVIRDDPSHPNRFSFRSEMELADHKHLNDYLNSVIQNSLAPGRITMDYKHPVVVDSFQHLSAFAKQQIPSALKRYMHDKKEPRLRVTYDTKENRVTDRLVKLKVADLHIFNPTCQDCRITINVELNFNRPDIDPEALIAPPEPQRPSEPSRRKDRLSYKHLAYTVDLTRIDTEGMNPKFELEEECDATLLRQQMQLVREGRKSGFGDIVSGFLDNLVFLMRERAPRADRV